jgi:hypothetical protein
MIMGNDSIEVNGLLLPPELVKALRDGRWVGLRAAASLGAVFNSEPVRPRFFDLREIMAINKEWHDESDPLYLGVASSSQYPGDIDPRRSLIVGELGPDQLVALDYRRSSSPEVIFASDDPRSPWRHVRSSVEELLAELSGSG